MFCNEQIHGEQRGWRGESPTRQPTAAAPWGLRAKADGYELPAEEAAGGQDGTH